MTTGKTVSCIKVSVRNAGAYVYDVFNVHDVFKTCNGKCLHAWPRPGLINLLTQCLTQG